MSNHINILSKLKSLGAEVVVKNNVLRGVIFMYTSVTDEDLIVLENATTIEFLDFAKTRITDAGLLHLRELSNLESIDLKGTSVEGIGLEYLSWQKMKTLSLISCFNFGDDGLRRIARFQNLERLCLNGTMISDEGLIHLAELRKLCFLSLDHTQITDAGLVNLKGLTNLRSLGTEGSRITEKGIADLQQSILSLSSNLTL